MSVLLLVAVALPAAWSLVACAAPPALRGQACRLAWIAPAGGLALAVVVLAAAVAGPVSLVVTGPNGSAETGLFADRLSAIMLVLILGVSAVVQAFSRRYLAGDPRQRRLVVVTGMTTSAIATVVTAATLSVLVAAWITVSAGLAALLSQRADLAAGRVAVRRSVTAFAVGDLALLLAGVVAWVTVGDLDLRSVGTDAARLSASHVAIFGAHVNAGALAACLIVTAAVARSAQLPLHRWLPSTLAAPTPVSAFLHAGLVNAGGFLLVRLGPLVSITPVASYLAFVAGAATMLYGTALMLAKPDVKGALAHSTMGQMGFMIMTCSLGAFAAAIFHLVAHGMYKATMFLGADSVVHNGKRRALVPRPAPPGVAWPPAVRLTVAALVPALTLGAALATFASPALEHPGALPLFVFAWTTAARAGYNWLAAAPGRAAAGMAALAVTCLAYAALVAGANVFLAPSLGYSRHPVSPWAAAGPALIILGALTLRYWPARWQRLLYVWALEAGHVPGSGRTARRQARQGAVEALLRSATPYPGVTA